MYQLLHISPETYISNTLNESVPMRYVPLRDKGVVDYKVSTDQHNRLFERKRENMVLDYDIRVVCLVPENDTAIVLLTILLCAKNDRNKVFVIAILLSMCCVSSMHVSDKLLLAKSSLG